MDIAGQSFGRLTVIKRHEQDYITPKTNKRHSRWVCQCSCGARTITTKGQLTTGKTQSCGCLQRERTAIANTRHGGRYERLHCVWANMKDRCYNSNYSEYKDYGGRGIRVCDEWLEYPAFREWAMSRGYDSTAERGRQTLDRIDVNGDYGPENCRFVDMFTQANNKQNNIHILYKGETHTLSEWSRILGIDYGYLYYRVRTKGLPMEEVVG